MALTGKEQASRNYLKERKPKVFEKVSRFTEKYKKGESIALIQLQYRYGCNMLCEHCSIEAYQKNAKGKKSLTPNDVKKLADQADEMGLARFVISGGEPTTFPDLDELVEAIGPDRFYINSDTNGYLLAEKVQHMKDIGIDRIQLSIDSLNPEEHDSFRKKPGAWQHAMEGMEECLKIGMPLFIQTVVTRQRLHSTEFIDFVEFFNNKGITVFITFAKPVGAYEGQFDSMIDEKDLQYERELEKKYKLCTHLTPGYGLNMGCIGVKDFISVTQYGDVQPCPYFHCSIGNVFDTPLKDIIQNGLKIKYFGEHYDECFLAQDVEWVKKYVAAKIYGKPVPVPFEEVFSEDDWTKNPYWTLL
ncbi:radical SAM/SPASM domain-containing protein [Butyrivibrio sp. NC2002]|uniref:radical SAM/SPASM domain-containing protein n=1 Tax=Butyrivibrio sp. NC2002 TaxID=1410610 RepID=UPI000567F85E|nr:radical SAM protein [Butyrivibrio sp. NC2002]